MKISKADYEESQKLTAGGAAGSTSQRRGELNFFKNKITRKMMDLFFTQDLG